MLDVPFCPNPRCQHHLHPSHADWFVRDGSHWTKAFGSVPRFLCRSCGRTFSTQTFSIDYYAKKVVDYRDLLARHSASEGIRGIGRGMALSCGTVLNRFDRLARQSAALHALLRPLARRNEDISLDGFVSFDVSQYFPNEITLSITTTSLFVLDLSHATHKRSGSMTTLQRSRAAQIYPRMSFEHGAVARSFREILATLASERPPAVGRPLVLITDEKRDYAAVLQSSELWRGQDESHRVAHIRVNSRLPRTIHNPLFPSNYLDREIRKDQANHHREATCFSRNVANAMSRLLCYLTQHNYLKRYRIKAPVEEKLVHGQVAGIGRDQIDFAVGELFTRRAFLTRLKVPATLERIWKKGYKTPLKKKVEYLPAFALG